MRLCSILDNLNALRLALIHKLVQIDDLSIQMNRHNGPSAWRHGGKQVLTQRKVGMARGLHWDRSCSTTQNGYPGRNKGMSRNHDLVARTNALRFDCKR